MLVTINTDASFIDGFAGYAFWIVCNEFKVLKAGVLRTKVKRPEIAEFKCIINAIHILFKNDCKNVTKIIINTDCLNVIHCIQNDKNKIDKYRLKKEFTILTVLFNKILKGKNIEIEELGFELNYRYWEKFYIAMYLKNGYNLNNHHEGGLSQKYLKSSLPRKPVSQETRIKLSIAHSKPRINKENFGVKKKIPVLQFTKDNIFIKEHLSALDAFRETGIWKESIRNCIKGRSRSAGGFIWKYK